MYPITLPAIDGTLFSTESLKGRPYMISFFRFATCPFCNMRVHQLVQRYDEFGEDFVIVALFDSSLMELQKSASRHEAPFPILADDENIYYKAYGIKRSLWGLLKGMVARFPTMMRGMFRGYIPFPIGGNMLTMPVDILVNREGEIIKTYHGKDEGDHLAIEEVLAFSRS